LKPDNYHLQAGSPCVDSGDPSGDYSGQTDIDGEPRVMGWYVDMGSDEVVPGPYYVDDDAPSDPGPGDPDISDPLEDGSPEHPFDAIQEAIDATMGGNTIVVLDGTYTGTGNHDIDFDGKAIALQSLNGFSFGRNTRGDSGWLYHYQRLGRLRRGYSLCKLKSSDNQLCDQ
jgi:hypothetical protein